MRPRSAAFQACLAEDFVTTSSRAWCKNRDLLADDIKRGWPSRGCDNERFGHSVCCFGFCRTDDASARQADMSGSTAATDERVLRCIKAKRFPGGLKR